MKYIFIALLALASAFTGVGQTLCHDEPICTPAGGCRFVTICRAAPAPAPPPAPLPSAPLPPPPMPIPMTPVPQPVQCHDEPVCTPAAGCRFVTVCK